MSMKNTNESIKKLQKVEKKHILLSFQIQTNNAI